MCSELLLDLFLPLNMPQIIYPALEYSHFYLVFCLLSKPYQFIVASCAVPSTILFFLTRVLNPGNCNLLVTSPGVPASKFYFHLAPGHIVHLASLNSRDLKGVWQKVTSALSLELEVFMIKIKCKAIVFCDLYTVSDTGRNKIFWLSEITTLEGLVSLHCTPNKQLDSARGTDRLFYCVFSGGISSGKKSKWFPCCGTSEN